MSEVIFGSPAQIIVDYAADNHFDLIVMGTHGRTGMAHLPWEASPSASCGPRDAQYSRPNMHGNLPQMWFYRRISRGQFVKRDEAMFLGRHDRTSPSGSELVAVDAEKLGRLRLIAFGALEGLHDAAARSPRD